MSSSADTPLSELDIQANSFSTAAVRVRLQLPWKKIRVHALHYFHIPRASWVVYKEWAMTLVHGKPSQKATRRYAAGLINLRPDRDGRIVAYEGMELLEEISDLIIDHHLPPVGSSTQPVEAGYMANAWIRVRHPDYDHLRLVLNTIGEKVQVRAR